MSQSAPQGWYPQPDGSQRFWDGIAWTAHTQSLPPKPANEPTYALTYTGFALGSLAIVALAIGSPLLPNVGPSATGETGNSLYAPQLLVLALSFWIAVFGIGTCWFGYRQFKLVDPKPRRAIAAILLNGIAILASVLTPMT